MTHKIKSIIKESNSFYPTYLKAHSNKTNRFLHFVGATIFFICTILFFITYKWYLPILAISFGYILPGIGHRYLQHNDSFRTSKPIICVLCATKQYWDTLTFQISKKMNNL
jgi:hypothetical protein